MQSVPCRVPPRKPSSPRRPLPPVQATGELTTGIDTGLADLFAEAAVLTIHSPTGQGLYWLGAITDAGKIVGLQLRKFGTGELYRITFGGARWECDCPDCTYRQRDCKHLIAVRDALTCHPVIDRKTERDELTGPGPEGEAA
jgi:hypothetical protein